MRNKTILAEKNKASQLPDVVLDRKLIVEIKKDFVYIISEDYKDKSIIQKGLVDIDDKE